MIFNQLTMRNLNEDYFRNHRIGYQLEMESKLEEEIENDRKPDRVEKFFIGCITLLFVLIFANEIFKKTFELEGEIISYSFLKGDMGERFGGTGFVSMVGGDVPDSYQISVSLDSGEIVSFNCYSCREDSYKPGDRIEFVRQDKFIGFLSYREKRKK